MSTLIEATELQQLSWLEIDLTLIAHAAPRRAHPLAVIEAVFKGVFEASRLDARQVKQLWRWPDFSVDMLSWQKDTRIPITIQLFGLTPAQCPVWLDQLQARFAPASKQNFTLAQVSPWRIARPPTPPAETTALILDFLTPVSLPHQPGHPNTALDGSGFIRLCQTRLRKLFGREGQLPPPPELDTASWRYWRTEHRSRSQGGHPMFINGCVGPLHLSGSVLPLWLSWLGLFGAVGLGERLSFAQGRLTLRHDKPIPASAEAGPAPLRLRRPFVLDAAMLGARLSLANANIVVSREDATTATRLPLMRVASIELHAPCMISSALLDACATEGIPVLLAAPGEAPLIIAGHQAEARRYRTLAAHHAAWSKLDQTSRTRIAARLIDAKLACCALLVRQRYGVGDHHLMAQLERARAAIARTDLLPVVRGWEGWAARHYHRWFGQHALRLGAFERRQQRNETQNPINMTLNYGYALLRHRVGSSVRLAGLDPYLGILHDANGRHDALVSDLMEPYRPYVDRLVLRLINLKVLQPASFVEDDGVLRFATAARMRMVQAFTRMLEGTPRHGGLELYAHLRSTVSDYRDAALNNVLTDWAPTHDYDGPGDRNDGGRRARRDRRIIQ